MSHPTVALGEVLELDLDQVIVDPSTTYRMAGVYGFGNGLFAREPIRGSETSYKKLTRLHEGQLVYGRLNAWEGGIAVVTPDFDGFFMSSEFPTFTLDPERVTATYLDKVCRWPAFWAELYDQSRGMGSNVGARRLRLHHEQLLQTTIPLPDIRDQTRIADALGDQLHKVESVEQLATGLVAGYDRLMESYLHETFTRLLEDYGSIRLDAAVEINPENVNPSHEFDDEFLYIDIGAVENGTGRIAMPRLLSPSETPSRARRLIREGDVIVSTVRPNLKGFARVTADLNGAVCSTGFAVLRPRPGLLSDFLSFFVHSDVFVTQLATTGGHYPAVTDKRLRGVEVMRPPLAVQEATVSRMRRFWEILEAIRVNARHRLAGAEALRISLLNRALNGIH